MRTRSWSLLLTLSLVSCGGDLGDAPEGEPDAANEASAGDTSADALADASLDAHEEDTATDDAGSDAADAPTSPDADAVADAVADAPEPACPVVTACPKTPSGLVEGSGLRAIDECAFPLADTGETPSRLATIAELEKALPKATLADVLGDLNRDATPITKASLPGVPGFQAGFAWNAGDQGVAYWIPQGLTGSADAHASGLVSGRSVVLVTWYHDPAKESSTAAENGVRISIADVTNPAKVSYRHLLLVEPKTIGGRPSFAPVNIHAGGAAWIGDRLYVADTSRGFRVFDLSRILRVATTKDVVGWDAATSSYQGAGYKYVVPQVALFRHQAASACAPVFSWVALDRSTSPPSLVSGEYSADSIAGRVFRWPLDASGALAAKTFPSGAWVMGHSHVQGGVSRAGRFYLASSKPAAGKGELYVTRPSAKTVTRPWGDAPEDLMVEPKTGRLWGATEAEGKRWVFAVDAAALGGP